MFKTSPFFALFLVLSLQSLNAADTHQAGLGYSSKKDQALIEALKSDDSFKEIIDRLVIEEVEINEDAPLRLHAILKYAQQYKKNIDQDYKDGLLLWAMQNSMATATFIEVLYKNGANLEKLLNNEAAPIRQAIADDLVKGSYGGFKKIGMLLHLSKKLGVELRMRLQNAIRLDLLCWFQDGTLYEAIKDQAQLRELRSITLQLGVSRLLRTMIVDLLSKDTVIAEKTLCASKKLDTLEQFALACEAQHIIACLVHNISQGLGVNNTTFYDLERYCNLGVTELIWCNSFELNDKLAVESRLLKYSLNDVIKEKIDLEVAAILSRRADVKLSRSHAIENIHKGYSPEMNEMPLSLMQLPTEQNFQTGFGSLRRSPACEFYSASASSSE